MNMVGDELLMMGKMMMMMMIDKMMIMLMIGKMMIMLIKMNEIGTQSNITCGMIQIIQLLYIGGLNNN